MGLEVWCADEAGPFQAIPQHGLSWNSETDPKCLPHEYVRSGTAKLLTILHPANGQVIVKGVKTCTNAALHPWLKKQFEKILKNVPGSKNHLSKEENRKIWQHWQKGLQIKFTLCEDLPRLRGLLVWDNLAGHKTPENVNMISAVSPRVDFRFMVVEGSVGATVFIEFLKRLMVGAKKKIFLIVDGYPAHKSKKPKNILHL